MTEEKQEDKKLSVADLGATMERMLPKGKDALSNKAIFERTELIFPMNGKTCTDGVFYDADGTPQEFKLTVVALTHKEELEATRDAKSPTDLPFLNAKRSMFKFNGDMLDEKQRNFLWEAIGPRGRQVVTYYYSQINSAGDEDLGKGSKGWEV